MGRLTGESIMSNNTIDTEMRKDFHNCFYTRVDIETVFLLR